MTVRRAAIYTVNGVLVLTIAGIILATWMPAIYVSPWFQHSPWVRVHLLGVSPTAAAASPPAAGQR